MSERGAATLRRVRGLALWVRALGLPALGTLLGAVAAFTTLSMADHLFATLGAVAVAVLLFGGALRGSLVRLARERALCRLVAAAVYVDDARALEGHAEGTRVRIHGIARVSGRAHKGWIVADHAGLLPIALDFWLVDARGDRIFVEAVHARLLGQGGLRDGDEVEVSGALGWRIDRSRATPAGAAYRDAPRGFVLKSDGRRDSRPDSSPDYRPLVVAPGMRSSHAL